VRDVFLDGLNQVRHALEYAAAEAFAGQFPKEALHQIEPRATRRRKMHVKAGMPREPLLHLGMLVRGVIVHDEMQGLVLGRLSINQPHEGQPFRVAMARKTGGNNMPFHHIQGRKQGGGAMSLIVMGHRFPAPLLERESRLGAIQSLDLTLLIDAEDERMFGGIQIQSHHVIEFLEELGILAELEGSHQVGFEPMGFPDTLHQGGVGAEVLGQRTQGPVRGCRRRRAQCGRDNAFLKGLPGLWRSTATGRVLGNPRDAVSREALPPQAHGGATAPHDSGNVLILVTLRSEQRNLGAKDEASGCSSASRPLFQLSLFRLGQLKGRGNTHRHLLWLQKR